jgi:hypothetical protein
MHLSIHIHANHVDEEVINTITALILGLLAPTDPSVVAPNLINPRRDHCWVGRLHPSVVLQHMRHYHAS